VRQHEGQDPWGETTTLLWGLYKKAALAWAETMYIDHIPLMIADKGIREGMSLPLNVEYSLAFRSHVKLSNTKLAGILRVN